MTQLLYRLDDDVTVSYQEYLEKKDSCKTAFIFRIEHNEYDHDTEIPKKWSDIHRKVNIPFQHGKFIRQEDVS